LKLKWQIGIRLKFLVIFVSSLLFALISITVLQSLFGSRLNMLTGGSDAFEQKYSFYYLLLFFILMTLFFYLFSYRMMRRIQHINNCVNKIGKGNWNVQLQTSAKDEIGNLSRQINQMVHNLRQMREKEQAAELLKTEMIANISHDLRTPITSLAGYIELIKDRGKEQEKYIHIATRKCDELKKLIQDLLEYCTLSYREYHLNKEKVEIRELLQQVIIDFVPQLEQANMSFQVESPSTPVLVDVDIKLVVRMLQNMIRNSIAYGAKGRKLDFGLQIDSSFIHLSITNYGEAIPEKDLPHIFERFYRGEKSRSADTGGKGMGLAISKNIAKMHGGDIKVTSSHQATVFIIQIPFRFS